MLLPLYCYLSFNEGKKEKRGGRAVGEGEKKGKGGVAPAVFCCSPPCVKKGKEGGGGKRGGEKWGVSACTGERGEGKKDVE